MKKSKFSQEQIAFALHQADTGTSVEEVCRKVAVSQATFYAWKKKARLSELRRLKRTNGPKKSRILALVCSLPVDTILLHL